MNETVELFEVEDGVLIPTKHCYALDYLKAIMDEKDKEYLNIFKYLFYMTCPYPKKNPFFNRPAHEKEDDILASIKVSVSLDNMLIDTAKEELTKLYDSRGVQMFKSMAVAVETVSVYMQTVTLRDGKDGNVTAVINTIGKYNKLREEFEKAENAFMASLVGKRSRGDEEVAYDQKNNTR